MLARPFFEYLAILGITAGIMIVTLLLSPMALVVGGLVVAASILVLVKHYHQADESTDAFA